MKQATLLSIVVYSDWFSPAHIHHGPRGVEIKPNEKTPSFDERLALIRKIEEHEALATVIANLDVPGTLTPYQRKERLETIAECKATVAAFLRIQEELHGNIVAEREFETVLAACSATQAPISGADTNSIAALIRALSEVLATLPATEEALTANLAAFDSLRKEIQAPIGDPEARKDDDFVAIAAKKLRLEAMAKHLGTVLNGVHQAHARLAPLVLECDRFRREISRIVKRGRAELLARELKADCSCLGEARRRACGSEAVKKCVPPSRGADFVKSLGRNCVTFDQLKNAALLLRDELEDLAKQKSAISESLGRDIPSAAEFFFRLCPCGCGREVSHSKSHSDVGAHLNALELGG